MNDRSTHETTDGVREVHPSDTELLYPIIRQLRPHLSVEQFVGRVARMREAGYRMAAVFAPEPCSVAGFRIGESLAWGRFMYVDDLVTDEFSRGHGHGTRLFRWLVAVAREAGCDKLHLDSGVQRFDAHRLYITAGMHISSHHFSMVLT